MCVVRENLCVSWEKWFWWHTGAGCLTNSNRHMWCMCAVQGRYKAVISQAMGMPLPSLSVDKTLNGDLNPGQPLANSRPSVCKCVHVSTGEWEANCTLDKMVIWMQPFVCLFVNVLIFNESYFILTGKLALYAIFNLWNGVCACGRERVFVWMHCREPSDSCIKLNHLMFGSRPSFTTAFQGGLDTYIKNKH